MDVVEWSSPEWLAQARSWLDGRLRAAGIERTGPVERLRVRPWAAVLTAPTTTGPVWLKACGADTAFEVRLYALLVRVAPDRVLRPIASDPARGWVLLPDGGTALGDRYSGVELVEPLAAAMRHYGRLQRAVAPHAAEMLALGMTDMRAATIPERFDTAVEVVSGLVERHGTADDRASLCRAAGLRDAVAAWSDELAAMPGPASVDHNDLHPYNILTGDRFYDWGDAVVAHPFASALAALGGVCEQLGADQDHPAVQRVRDGYLDAFADLAPHAELVRTLELACRLAKIARTLTWYRAIRHGDPADGAYVRAPIVCLASLLDDSYLGGT